MFRNIFIKILRSSRFWSKFRNRKQKRHFTGFFKLRSILRYFARNWWTSFCVTKRQWNILIIYKFLNVTFRGFRLVWFDSIFVHFHCVSSSVDEMFYFSPLEIPFWLFFFIYQVVFTNLPRTNFCFQFVYFLCRFCLK